MTIIVSSLAQHQHWRHRINVDSTLVMFVTLFRCWADVCLPDGLELFALAALALTNDLTCIQT